MVCEYVRQACTASLLTDPDAFPPLFPDENNEPSSSDTRPPAVQSVPIQRSVSTPTTLLFASTLPPLPHRAGPTTVLSLPRAPFVAGWTMQPLAITLRHFVNESPHSDQVPEQSSYFICSFILILTGTRPKHHMSLHPNRARSRPSLPRAGQPLLLPSRLAGYCRHLLSLPMLMKPMLIVTRSLHGPNRTEACLHGSRARCGARLCMAIKARPTLR